MYSIYIENYSDPEGNYSPYETLLYSVPITSGYEDNVLIDPVVKTEMGKAGSFEFSIRPNNPYYNSWLQMRTISRIEYDGSTIFRGRVLTIDDSMDGTRRIHFEGDLAFLLDSYQPPSEEADREEITIKAYLEKLIKCHNYRMYDFFLDEMGDQNESSSSGGSGGSGGAINPPVGLQDIHQMTIGEVPGHYSPNVSNAMKVLKNNPKKKFGTDSWVTTMAALEELQSEYGGYFHTRYENNVCYLDWLESYFNKTVNSQTIELGENLVSLNNSTEVDNIFTAVIPIGKKDGKDIYIKGYKEDIHGHNDRILVPDIAGGPTGTDKQKVFTDSELNNSYHTAEDYRNAISNYGLIYVTQSFENADTQEKLWNYATEWIKNNYIGGVVSFDVTAVDMHHIDSAPQKYLVGDRVRITYTDPDGFRSGSSTRKTLVLTIMGITYNLHNPENNQYSIGTPTSTLEKEYGKKSQKVNGGASSTPKPPPEDKLTDYEQFIKDTKRDAWNYIVDKKRNNELYTEVVDKYGSNAGKAVQKMTHSMWVNTYQIAAGQTGFSNEVNYAAVVVDGAANQIKVYNSLPGVSKSDKEEFAEKIRDQVKSEFDAAESMILDGELGQMTIKQKVDLAQKLTGLPTPNARDEALAKYIAYYKVNPKSAAIVMGLDHSNSSTSDPAGLLRFNKLTPNVGTPNDPLGLINATNKNTASFKGEDGSANTQINRIGEDGTGDNANIIENGMDGSATFKLHGSEDWQITVNVPIVYTDENGNRHTINNGVKANDLYLKDIGSCYSKLIVVRNLVAKIADIENLYATRADVDNLLANYIQVDNLSATFSSLSDVGFVYLHSREGRIHSHIGSFDQFFINGKELTELPSGVKTLRLVQNDNNTYTLQYQDYYNPGTWKAVTGGNFSRATTLEGKWGSGSTASVYTVTASPQGNKKRVKVKTTISYNSSTHIYTASTRSDDPDEDGDDDMIRSSVQSGTEAYRAGYSDGAESVETIVPTFNGLSTSEPSGSGRIANVGNISAGTYIKLKVGSGSYFIYCSSVAN